MPSSNVTTTVTSDTYQIVAALTAGQINIGAVEGSLFNRAAVVFFTLAENWVWIILATLASAVIVLVRRKRA